MTIALFLTYPQMSPYIFRFLQGDMPSTLKARNRTISCDKPFISTNRHPQRINPIEPAKLLILHLILTFVPSLCANVISPSSLANCSTVIASLRFTTYDLNQDIPGLLPMEQFIAHFC